MEIVHISIVIKGYSLIWRKAYDFRDGSIDKPFILRQNPQASENVDCGQVPWIVRDSAQMSVTSLAERYGKYVQFQ